ncbi:MAG TPA: hypothetical protein VGG46_08940 [Terriglobales bacterium]|jgi:hypothetical protein
METGSFQAVADDYLALTYHCHADYDAAQRAFCEKYGLPTDGCVVESLLHAAAAGTLAQAV